MLGEESSKHAVQVLRMLEYQDIRITNGLGILLTCTILSSYKKQVRVCVKERVFSPRAGKSVSIAISNIKNSGRFEIFLEKATELGITEIVPLICGRTEKIYLKKERLHKILVSAMLQSRQNWMPELKEPIKFTELIKEASADQKFIAHCIDTVNKREIPIINGSSQILIGPEGDFSENEINQAESYGYQPVSLGETRLRTETAGIVAAVLLKNRVERSL